MYVNWFWKTDGPSLQSFDSGSEIQVFTLNVLGIFLSDHDFVGRQATWISAPIITKLAFDPDSIVFKQLEQLSKSSICSTAQDKSDDLARVMVNQVPSLLRLGFFGHKRPLIRFRPFDAHFVPPI